MIKLALAVSYFNSVKELPRLLNPIRDNIDMVIAIDGKYPLFKWPENKSTDGSTELLIEKYNAVVYQFDKPVEQIEKRNKYMEIADKAGMDLVLVLDADDYLHPAPINQRWNIFNEQLEAFNKSDELLANVWIYESKLHEKNWNSVADNKWIRYTRIMKPHRVRYDTTHYTYVDMDDPEYFIMPLQKAIDGCRFTTDSILREKKYVKAGYEWAEKQMIEENERMKRSGRKRFNFWKKQMEKAMASAIPGTINYNTSISQKQRQL